MDNQHPNGPAPVGAGADSAILQALQGLSQQVGGLTSQVQANNDKVDSLGEKVEGLEAKVNKMDQNWNGDGSTQNRGWKGAVEDLQNQVKGHSSVLAKVWTYANIPVTLAVVYIWTFFVSGGHPPSPSSKVP